MKNRISLPWRNPGVGSKRLSAEGKTTQPSAHSKYLSPGLKSDILHGKTGACGAATSRFNAYLSQSCFIIIPQPPPVCNRYFSLFRGKLFLAQKNYFLILFIRRMCGRGGAMLHPTARRTAIEIVQLCLAGRLLAAPAVFLLYPFPRYSFLTRKFFLLFSLPFPFWDFCFLTCHFFLFSVLSSGRMG